MLTVMTVNVTGWGSCLEQLEQGRVGDDVQAILLQEHRLHDDLRLAAAVRAAKREGWVADFMPAIATDKGGASSGVGILVRGLEWEVGVEVGGWRGD